VWTRSGIELRAHKMDHKRFVSVQVKLFTNLDDVETNINNI